MSNEADEMLKPLTDKVEEIVERYGAPLGAKEEQMTNEAESLLGAIARGWCHPKNASKEFDSDLALAIAAEVHALKSPPSEIAPTRDAVLVPLKLLEQCEVWIGTAAHVGITTHYPDGTETENRLALLKAADELRALLYRASQERHSERSLRPVNKEEK